MFCELGDWVSSCFDQWFLRADVRRITGYPKSARVVTMHGDLVQAIYRISGDCEGTLGGLNSFGESGI